MGHVVTFYKFVRLAQPERLRDECHELAAALALKGTILIAQEGINGTLTGSLESLQAFAGQLRERPEFNDMLCRYSYARDGNPVFHRLKVRLRPEIVSFGAAGIDPALRTGEHVDAQRWNELLDDPAVLVVDTRNSYEIGIGSFPGALNPETTSFREFPRFVGERLDPQRHPQVAMYCTGGIRCEKASAFLLAQGFAHVYQLDGGILRYLEEIAADDNRWRGECFVFDQRISVDASLGEGTYQQCFACRRPLSAQDLVSADYRPGISCPHCVTDLSSARVASFTERNRQVALAAARGERHIGVAQHGAGVKKS